MNFTKEVTVTGGTTFFITILAFLNNVIVTRQLGPDGRGKYVVVSNLILFLALFLGEGVRRTNTILSGKNKKDLVNLLAQTFLYLFFLLLVFTVGYYFRNIWKNLFPDISDQLLFIGLVITLVVIFWRAVQALFLGLKKIIEYNVIQLISTISFVFLNIVGIVFFDFFVFGIIINLFIASLLALFYGLFQLRTSISITNISLKYFKNKSLWLSTKSTVSAIFVFLLLKGPIFLINYFLTPLQAGIYSIALIFSDMLQKIPNVIGPLLVSEKVNDNSEKTFFLTARLFRIILFFNFCVVSFLFLFGKYLIIALFTVEFIQSYTVLLYMGPALLFLAPGMILYAYFIGKSYPRFILVLNFIVSMINILLNIILIPLYGFETSAILFSITFVIWTFILVFFFKKETNIKTSQIIILQYEDIKYAQKLINIVLSKIKKR